MTLRGSTNQGEADEDVESRNEDDRVFHNQTRMAWGIQGGGEVSLPAGSHP
jgi:hypothetical protein